MHLRLSESSARLALGCLLSALIVALLGLLIFASQPTAKGAHRQSTTTVVGVRSTVLNPGLSGCAPSDSVCVYQRDQVQEIEQRIAARVLEREIALLQVEDYASASSHRLHTLWAHYFASWILLLVVVGIVTSGLYMSFLQLKRDLTTGSPNANSIKISKEGLEINSPVIGLLIFLASAYFFSLYVEKIYPLTFVSSEESSRSQAPKSPESAASGASLK